MTYSTDKALVLVVEDGFHTGARVTLYPGRTYRIGRDPACDLVLRDKGLSSSHVELQVSRRGNVFLSATGGQVRVNSRTPSESHLALSVDDVIHLGESTLRVCPPFHVDTTTSGEASGSDISASADSGTPAQGTLATVVETLDHAGGMVRRTAITVTAAIADLSPRLDQMLEPVLVRLDRLEGRSSEKFVAASARATAPLSNLIHHLCASRPIIAVNRRVRAALTRVTGLLPKRLARRLQGRGPVSWPTTVGGTTLAMALIAIPVWIGISGLTGSESMQSRAEELRGTLAAQGLDHLRVDADNQRRELKISGVITDRTDLETLQHIAGDSPLPVKTNVSVAREEVARMRAVLGRMGLPRLDVAHAGGDTFRITGFIPDKAQWQQVASTLRRDFPALGTLRDELVYDMDQFIAALRHRLDAEDLLDHLRITREESTHVVVSGIVGQPRLERWARVLAGVRQELGNTPRIESRVRSINDLLPVDLRSISLGDVPFVVTRDGNRYMVGATLGDGYVIDAIHSDHLVLQRGDRTFRYQIGTSL